MPPFGKSNNCYGALRPLMLCLLREGIHGVLPTGGSSPEEEAPFGGSTLPMLSEVCCVPHFSYPQRCFMAHRRAVNLWSIHQCLCSRADRPELVCRICRQRSPPAIQRFLDRLWLLTQGCDGAAALMLNRWDCVFPHNPHGLPWGY